MPANPQRFPGTPLTPIGEKTPCSVASGNAHFVVAWTRGSALTSERCERDGAQLKATMRRLGNTEARLKQTLHHRTERTASNARAVPCVLLLFYFRVSQDYPSWITSIDRQTPDLPMKTVNGF